jgi:KUP system potassium uptake protein
VTSGRAVTERGQGGRDVVRLAVIVGALGVVFGDIGTSPIYTLQTVFNPADPHPVPVSTDNVFGVVSLVFWAVMIIMTFTYVLLAMRDDNQGEGGIMALITQLRRWPGGSRRAAAALATLGIFGAALFFGDSMITPAISVLSAVEGLKVVNPSLENLIIPVTVVIIVVLFAVQRRGTAAVGRIFGPVMIVWFLVIGGLGMPASPTTRAFSGRCRRHTRWVSCSATSISRSSPWPRSCSPSLAPRRCTPTWGTSVAARSPGAG